MGSELFLSADPALKVQECVSADGVSFWVLGHALLSDRRGRLEDAFPEVMSDDVLSWTASWSGRWLLITRERCVPDASGSLGLFYTKNGESVWLSSSIALLSHYVPQQTEPPAIKWDVVHGRGIDWIPIPMSTREGVLKLLPFRSISTTTGQIAPLTMPSLGVSPSDEPIVELASRLVMIARNASLLPLTDRRVFLTAGLDTRTILSAFIAAGTECPTQTGVFPRMRGAADKWLPPKIAAAAGVPHEIVSRLPLDDALLKARLRVVEEHTDGQAAGSTAVHHCAHATTSRATESTIHFGGLGFELGRCFFWNWFGPTDAEYVLAQYPRQWGYDEKYKIAISSWVASLSDEIPLVMDWRDRFYLEQRLGGWASANHQCNDILTGLFLNPANCAQIFRLMLQLPEQDRRSGLAQKRVIQLLAPEIANFPLNPEPWRKIVWRKARAVKRKVGKLIG